MSKDKRYYSLFPKTLSSCIEPLTRPVLKSQGIASSRLLSQWQEVVGEAMATRSYPAKLTFPRGKTTEGTLTIAVENGFATEIQHMMPVILERLATYYGYKAVSRIVISHSYSPLEKPKKPKPKRVSNVDYTELTKDIGDDDLKLALESFAQTLSDKKT
ncbi:MAG: DUF721 domain-containing protein [Rickettsiales bacterium]